jgi:photosystem II stability/assembly factor-like uncharacterized protein
MSSWTRHGAAVSMVLVSALVVAGGLAAAAPSAAAGWSSVSPVSCVSVNHCSAGVSDAAGSGIIVTVDGGSHWSVQYRTNRFSYIADIDCTSARHCVAAGDIAGGSGVGFLQTTDGGKTWTERSAPASMATVDTISCAGNFDCWAVGHGQEPVASGVLARTTDGGRVWTPESIPQIVTAMNPGSFGLSCPSEERCVVTGDSTLTTDNGGKTWTKRVNPDDAVLGPVDCPSVHDCYAVFNVTSAIPANEETFVYRSSNAGLTWKRVLDDPHRVVALSDISCPSTSTCVAVGGGYTPGVGGKVTLYGLTERTTDRGRTWAETRVRGTENLLADSCAVRTGDCVAAGLAGAKGVIRRSTNDGATWVREALPTPHQAVAHDVCGHSARWYLCRQAKTVLFRGILAAHGGGASPGAQTPTRELELSATRPAEENRPQQPVIEFAFRRHHGTGPTDRDVDTAAGHPTVHPSCARSHGSPGLLRAPVLRDLTRATTAPTR